MANKNRRRYKKGKTFKKILREKLGVMIIIILLAFGGLCVRLVYITRDNQESYQKKILTQQRYDSTTLPFKREPLQTGMEQSLQSAKRYIM